MGNRHARPHSEQGEPDSGRAPMDASDGSANSGDVEKKPRWRLVRGGEILAILFTDGRSVVPERDSQFTIEAAYELMPAFEAVRHLFEREMAIIDDEGDAEQAEWYAIWEELTASGLLVESIDGQERWTVQWIHFAEERTWWWPLMRATPS